MRRAASADPPPTSRASPGTSMGGAVDSLVKFPATDHLAPSPALVDDEEQQRMQALQARAMGGRRFFGGMAGGGPIRQR